MVMEFAEGGHVMLSDSSSPNDVYALSEGVARKYFRDVIKVGPWLPEATCSEAGLVNLVGAPNRIEAYCIWNRGTVSAAGCSAAPPH